MQCGHRTIWPTISAPTGIAFEHRRHWICACISEALGNELGKITQPRGGAKIFPLALWGAFWGAPIPFVVVSAACRSKHGHDLETRVSSPLGGWSISGLKSLCSGF